MNIKCKIFGHKYKVEKQFKFNCQKLTCTRCNKKFAINHNLQIILPWDKEFEMLHEGNLLKVNNN